ncbi:exosortase Y [Mucilaginibacter arboris]|uniref:Glycosyltransferase n=1 Tax=Mucilaginibacter arboris TaxID=2682090 RepID=A0A7K1STL7_9SPHI|nr:glycosyltransferase [Mucilaginibacter arboris]MVN20614.1 glycosyltransferase [Mucilaginibacter arboris]
MRPYSFIILTFNEEVHLPRLLQSIQTLNAPVFILDSGSTDATLTICKQFDIVTASHPFKNHPKQWDFALKNFDIKTPWVICLDADQQVSPELLLRLQNFEEQQFSEVNGIYFNRKNYFKGSWIKHGGYYPFYQLKMFRYDVGFSDLNENMDHRFIAPGKTVIWKDGYLREENLKENQIRFWIDKHNNYSDLLAFEEVERMQKIRQQTLKPKFGGTPDERTAWLKNIWWKLPRYWRPLIYFFYRLIIQRGFLDGKKGIIFHFLQGFWFRLMVDVKIDELMQKQEPNQKIKQISSQKPAIKFAFHFLFLFAIFYGSNLFYNGLMQPGGNYNAFLSQHFNYIQWLRNFLLDSSSAGLQLFGYQTKINSYSLMAVGYNKINLAYDCLGLGVMSFLTAFALTFPTKIKSRIQLWIGCIIGFQLLNILRFMLLALYWKGEEMDRINHHTVFNGIIYVLIALTLYFFIEKSTIKEAWQR